MGKNYKKLMAVDTEELKKKPFCQGEFTPEYSEPVNASLRPMLVVKDLLKMGRRQVAMKWGISEVEVRKIYREVVRRIENSFLRKSQEDGDTYFKRFGLKDCRVGGCTALATAGMECPKHFSDYRKSMIRPFRQAKVSKLKKQHTAEKRAIKKTRPVPSVIPEAVYSEVMRVIISSCLTSGQSYAGRYYADMDNDLVDMAVKGHFVSTKAVKAMLVQAGVEIGRILRGLENRHMRRFDEEAVKWAVVYEQFVKEAKRKRIA